MTPMARAAMADKDDLRYMMRQDIVLNKFVLISCVRREEG